MLYFACHFLRRSTRLHRATGRWRSRITEVVRAGGPARVLPVDRRADLTPEEFRRDYLRAGVPVVIPAGAQKWTAVNEWSFDSFRERYGDEDIKLVQREGLTDAETSFTREYSEEIRFGTFIDDVLGGGTKYMRFSPLLEQFPELLEDLDFPFFKRMVGTPWGQAFQLFIGGKGTLTPFHNAMTPFFFTVVCGTKRWSLIPNHYMAVLDPVSDRFQYNHTDVAVDLSNVEEYPGIDCVDRYETVIRSGDLLFVPSWMWHAVSNDSATIGIRCGFMHVVAALRQSLTLTILRMVQGEPSVIRWLYYSYVRTDLPQRSELLLTSRMFTGPDGRAEGAALDEESTRSARQHDPASTATDVS